MSRRQATQAQSHTGTKFLFLLAVILLVFWAGHDPTGALALIRHIGQGIASIAQAASHARSTKK
jgi:hypothetical protein